MCESTPTSPNLSRKQQSEFPALDPQLRQRSSSVHKRWTRLLQQARRQTYNDSRCDKADYTIAGEPPVLLGDGPEHYVHLMHIAPLVQSFPQLKKKLTQCDAQWMLNFLELNGHGLLFEGLVRLSQPSTANIARAYAQVEVVESLKAVMNSQVGLDFIIDDQEFTRKLATGKHTRSTRPVFLNTHFVLVLAQRTMDTTVSLYSTMKRHRSTQRWKSNLGYSRAKFFLTMYVTNNAGQHT